MRIYLTGFMGAGKTYVGTRLAERLGYPFVDLDAHIETLTERTVAEIFANYGEAAFRSLESQALRTLLQPDLVVATGGGAPCFDGNMEWMNAHGHTVFLDPDPATLLARLTEGRDHRPLLQTPTALRELITAKLTERRPVYERARTQLSGPAATIDTVDHLATLLENPPK